MNYPKQNRRSADEGAQHQGSVGGSGSTRTDVKRELLELRRFANLLDEAFRIPIIGYRVGLEPLIGLVPVIGDFSGFVLSGYLILRAARLGVPRETIVRMVVNALLDAIIGSIPVVGDVFDFFWKVNKRNLRLVERHLRAQG